MAKDTACTLRELREKLEAHTGEMVLVVTRRYEFHGCHVFGPRSKPWDYQLTADIYLGRIALPFISIDERSKMLASFTLHTQDKKLWIWIRGLPKWLEKDGDISPPFHDLGVLERPIYPLDDELKSRKKSDEERGWTDPDYALEIIIGNQAVEEWLNARISVPDTLPDTLRYTERYKERMRRVFSPEILEGALEVMGIAEERRTIEEKKLQKQQKLLWAIHSGELALLTGPSYVVVKSIESDLKKNIVAALELGAHRLERYKAMDGKRLEVYGYGGVDVYISPYDFLKTNAERWGIRFPEK